MPCRLVGLIIALALGLCCGPLAAAAQPARTVSRLRVLLTGHAAEPAPSLDASRQGRRERSWVGGQNIVLEYRYAERVRLPVDVLFATTAQGARAAQQATTTISIVFETLGGLVVFGLVDSLERPGGNLTGVGGMAPEMHGKHLELLQEVLPGLTLVATRGGIFWDLGDSPPQR